MGLALCSGVPGLTQTSCLKKMTSETAIVKTAAAPLRREAAESSEMVSQLLLGESAEVLGREERWVQVRCHHDNYPGWLSITQVHLLSSKDAQEWIKPSQCIRSIRPQHDAIDDNGAVLRVPWGSVIPRGGAGEYHYPFGIYRARYRTSLPSSPADVAEAAGTLAGVPYLWGGRSEMGIDCSGLVQLVFLIFGVHLPRDASQQFARQPCFSNSIKDALRGDLIYFRLNGHISHVGICAGDGLMIHASGDVHTVMLDPDKRSSSRFAFNERLSGSICGIQRIEIPEI